MIELLLETAFIQPPTDQATEGPQNIRPAFKHIIKSVTIGNTKRSFGVIECDPLVKRGLKKNGKAHGDALHANVDHTSSMERV